MDAAKDFYVCEISLICISLDVSSWMNIFKQNHKMNGMDFGFWIQQRWSAGKMM